MSKVNLIRQGRSFAPATEQDEEQLKRVRTGERTEQAAVQGAWVCEKLEETGNDLHR